MTDGARMAELCAAVDAVFCVTTFFEAGTEAEVNQGTSLADVLRTSGLFPGGTGR